MVHAFLSKNLRSSPPLQHHQKGCFLLYLNCHLICLFDCLFFSSMFVCCNAMQLEGQFAGGGQTSSKLYISSFQLSLCLSVCLLVSFLFHVSCLLQCSWRDSLPVVDKHHQYPGRERVADITQITVWILAKYWYTIAHTQNTQSHKYGKHWNTENISWCTMNHNITHKHKRTKCTTH